MPGKGIKYLTRRVARDVELELWVRAGGRCQFNGHNAVLYRSLQTNARMNMAEKAHIYSFSKGGPRGRNPRHRSASQINGVDNLMLMCPGCHLEIDKDDGGRFPVELLEEWKRSHEERVELATSIRPDNKSMVVVYAGGIGGQPAPIRPEDAHQALFPSYFPAEPRPVELGM